MKRVCAYCKKTIGWKCDRCDGPVVKRFRRRGRLMGQCDKGHTFSLAGRYRTTHGICDQCLKSGAWEG